MGIMSLSTSVRGEIFMGIWECSPTRTFLLDQHRNRVILYSKYYVCQQIQLSKSKSLMTARQKIIQSRCLVTSDLL